MGEVLGALERLGLSDNTLVIFSSDNGALTAPTLSRLLRNHFKHAPNGPILRGGKGDIWEGGHRVPFLARWPGRIKPGARSAEMLCLTDIPATCAALIGKDLPPEAGPDSFNVLPALLGQKSQEPLRGPMVNLSGGTGMLAIREGPWKLIDGQGSGGYRTREAKPGEPPGQLYNLAKDLGETTNLYAQHPEIVQRLQQLLNKFKKQGRSR